MKTSVNYPAGERLKGLGVALRFQAQRLAKDKTRFVVGGTTTLQRVGVGTPERSS